MLSVSIHHSAWRDNLTSPGDHVVGAVILNLVYRLAHPLPQQTPEALHLKEEPTSDCNRYDTLRGKPHVH